MLQTLTERAKALGLLLLIGPALFMHEIFLHVFIHTGWITEWFAALVFYFIAGGLIFHLLHQLGVVMDNAGTIRVSIIYTALLFLVLTAFTLLSGSNLLRVASYAALSLGWDVVAKIHHKLLCTQQEALEELSQQTQIRP